jgi:integral membrane sensor domain MASE1
VAAIVATAAAAIGGTAGVVLVQGSTAPALTIWYHWLTSNVPGIVAVAPLLIGLASAIRDPPPRSEIIESVVALFVLSAHLVQSSNPEAGNLQHLREMTLHSR